MWIEFTVRRVLGMENNDYTIEVFCESVKDTNDHLTEFYGLRVTTSSEITEYPQITTDRKWLQQKAELLQSEDLFIPHIKDCIEDIVAQLVTV